LSAVALICLAAGGQPALAASYRDIYDFGNGPDGSGPYAALVADSEGRLYGTTYSGGAYGFGTVFRLTHPASGQGKWTEEILHSFNAADGDGPFAPVTLGSDGSVYGTTRYGGAGAGAGDVFKLSNTSGWPETILHSFFNGENGGEPQAGMVFGPGGLLYGTTSAFNINTYAELGTVFSVSATGSQTEFAVLHRFGKGSDGTGPSGLAPLPAPYGNSFVAATDSSSTGPYGSVFAETIPGSGGATESILYNFSASNGVGAPASAPLPGIGAIRNGLFGCAALGGSFGRGGCYSLLSTEGASFSESVLYSFGAQANDPQGSSIPGDEALVQLNTSGTLVGTSYNGGAYGGGTFFELDPPALVGGAWTEKVDVSFNPNIAGAGYGPLGATLRIGPSFYGSLSAGGATGNGAIYEVSP
jgi:uncharacterized repeat protein (TIGR03803 family)